MTVNFNKVALSIAHTAVSAIANINFPIISTAAASKRDELNRKRLLSAHVRGGAMQALDRIEHNMAVDAKKAAKRERQARRKERGSTSIVIALIIAAVAVVVAWWPLFVAQKDDTDALDKRSGFTLLKDYGTGCEYLARGSHFAPRLDERGWPICGRKEGKQ